ncbi:hypothetical protein BDA96_02G389800 [Sorghum bicolor]|uniref:Phorbol-ester/DAG-type domain-containing protein n=2 Tax=Sorghum bicolor TaxID=4558 RepID=A0A921RTD4_SORBI|nr:uncharacterized protein LOC8060672 [Sorghum bicolor]EER97526.1 hypothetical protein SORBI_3002G371900 [Sorghum bicolor]KAG0545761.1 hypothetical protein BDA96_02G389800 [Sorghum bicolor]|eukprot:XP_002461005.1 uncharacterized protein LOC8060672 [Sorghum bicolor]
MASNNNQATIRHFADPHPLGQTQYRHDEAGLCNICLLKLGGLRSRLTYGCYTCNIHLHSACARYFPETISFFAHPAHTLNLRRSPAGGRVCEICRGDCPPQGSFVYSCTAGCGFDVHPLCSMLPESVASPLDPSHQLCIFSSESPGSGSCSACHHPLPRWHYIGSSLKLHIACATGAAGQGSNSNGGGHAAVVQQGSQYGTVRQRSLFGAPAPGPAGYNYNPVIQGYGQAGSYYYVHPIHGNGIYYYGGPAMPSGGGYYGASGGGQQSIFQNPSNLMSGIARFLFSAAISAAASDLLSELLSASFS